MGRVVTCENNAVTRDVCKGVCEGHMKNVLRLEILVKRRNFKVDSHVVLKPIICCLLFLLMRLFEIIKTM